MRFLFACFAGLVLSSCYTPNNIGAGQPRPQIAQGQYQIPPHLRPEPTRRIPDDDRCRSKLYSGLVGQHEGAIVFAHLPGRTRVIKPAYQEIDRDDFLRDMQDPPPFMEVREYIAGQILYAPSIRAVSQVDELGPIIEDRLTIELDRDGYVYNISCR